MTKYSSFDGCYLVREKRLRTLHIQKWLWELSRDTFLLSAVEIVFPRILLGKLLYNIDEEIFRKLKCGFRYSCGMPYMIVFFFLSGNTRWNLLRIILAYSKRLVRCSNIGFVTVNVNVCWQILKIIQWTSTFFSVIRDASS